ncbi:hypothetical protein EON64_03115 [archaeon]|nr:MAG: hypothetical protein EON64_03115 [archaeon]
MEAFFESNHFKQGLNPLPHAYDVLQRMKFLYSLHVVTARQHKVEAITRSWLNTHFPNTFDEVHFGNHYSKDGKSRSKAEICKTIGAKLLIDDNMIYATQCALEGISVVLFGRYPWNREVYDHPSHFHDVSVVVNAHCNNEVVVEDFDPSHSLQTHIEEELAAPHHVYRVHSWEVMEQVVAYMLSKRRDMALLQPPTFLPTLTPISPPPSGKKSFGIVAIQMCSTDDKETNFNSTVSLIEEALQGGRHGGSAVDMICLPECSVFMGLNALQTVEQGENIEQSSYIHRVCSLAREKSVWISLGGFPEQSSIAADTQNNVAKLYNTHIVINRQGEVVARYRKVHLFDCPLVGLKESALTGIAYLQSIYV